MGRGRKEQLIVEIHSAGDQSTRIAPLNKKQLEKSGVDTSRKVYAEREVCDGQKEIRLHLSNDREELSEEEGDS